MARCKGERAALRRNASPTVKRWIRLWSRVVMVCFQSPEPACFAGEGSLLARSIHGSRTITPSPGKFFWLIVIPHAQNRRVRDFRKTSQLFFLRNNLFHEL